MRMGKRLAAMAMWAGVTLLAACGNSTSDGPASLADVAARYLDPARGTAIVTEGLLGYFARDVVEGMWRRFADTMSRHRSGVYLSDLNLAGDVAGMRASAVFVRLLSVFARGNVYLHYQDAAEAVAALTSAGFASAVLHRPEDFETLNIPGRDRRHTVRLVEARVAAR